MANETVVDWEAALAELEAKRAVIDQAIAGIRVMLGQAAPPPLTGKAPTHDAKEIHQDSFFGMTTPDAVKKYLGMMPRPQNPRVIADALVRGGQAKDAESAYVNAYSALKRMRAQGHVVKIGSEWALASRYPHLRKKTGDSGNEKGDKGSDVEAATASPSAP